MSHDNWVTNMDTTFENQCEGRQRVGGAFTFGPVIWYRCNRPGKVMLVMKGQEPSPACLDCWSECIKKNMEIENVEPITEEKPDES